MPRFTVKVSRRALFAFAAVLPVLPVLLPAQQPTRPSPAPATRPAAPESPTQRPPAALPNREMQFPRFVEFQLGNGLQVLVVPSAKQPVLTMRLSVMGGSLHDPVGKSGMADLVAGLLTKGAGTRDAEAFAEAIERVGGSLSAVAGPDFLTVEASVLSADRELAFSLMADALLRPTFPAEEVELLRTQTLSGLALARSQPDAIAGRIFARNVFGEHPYGRRADEASVQAITRDDLVGFHTARMRPAQALLVLAGAIDSTEAFRLAEQSFGAWSGRGVAAPPARPAPQRAQTEIVLVHRPGSVQSNILMGNTTWMPTDTRGYALAVANQILGGASDARLFQTLREERGWTYGAYSDVSRARGIGTFTATAEVRTDVTDSALVEMLAQLRRMASEPVPTAEFERQRQTMVGRFPLQVETAGQVAAQVANARLLGLATDYVQTYRQRIAAVTPEQAQAAARSGMRADAALVVVVGDATALKERLARVAPVTVVDIDGAPIAAVGATGAEGALGADGAMPERTRPPINREALQAGTDSFTVLVQGQPFGYQYMALTRTLDGWEFYERSALGPILQQTTTVRFSPSLEMWSTEQRGRFQGSELRLAVNYADGRARGEGITPGNGTMQNVRYANVTVPGGAIDDNLLVGLLPYFNWTLGATVPVEVFASGRGVAESRTFRVVSEEEIAIPLGTFRAYRIAYEGGEAPGTYWVEVAAPHRVLKFGPRAVPLEFVRAR